MKKFVILNKREGETPLEALEALRAKLSKKDESYKKAKLTYAGRLDPMASGLMPVIIGEEIKNKEKYLKLGKVYVFEVLFGFTTDTHDILGKVIDSKVVANLTMEDIEKDIKKNLKSFVGVFTQSYPKYSSKNIKKVRSGFDVDESSHKVEVKKLKFLSLRSLPSTALAQNVTKRIQKVSGDFRQKEILKIWNKNLQTPKEHFYVAKFTVSSGSGLYVRTLSHDLGVKMGIPALAFSIKRTKIGKWSKMTV